MITAMLASRNTVSSTPLTAVPSPASGCASSQEANGHPLSPNGK